MKILNIGSLNIDKVYAVDHFVRAGETLTAGHMDTFPGGKGLNQSIALARAGAEVWAAGAIFPIRIQAMPSSNLFPRGRTVSSSPAAPTGL